MLERELLKTAIYRRFCGKVAEFWLFLKRESVSDNIIGRISERAREKRWLLWSKTERLFIILKCLKR